ncbi:hypothetical protein diail_9688 [Diaporthe ilicicola]|nr:hypothetical protein diail_9688 [Diaporthe ilicicola]
MKFSAAAVLAVAAGASAFENVTYTTEVVTALTTFCPAATTLTHAGTTYTVSSATTLTITDCPCTITKPVTTQTSVACVTCAVPSPPVYPNGTAPAAVPTSAPVGTGGGSIPTTTGSSPEATSPIATAGAGRAAALSGAGLAGVLGLAAFFLNEVFSLGNASVEAVSTNLSDGGTHNAGFLSKKLLARVTTPTGCAGINGKSSDLGNRIPLLLTTWQMIADGELISSVGSAVDEKVQTAKKEGAEVVDLADRFLIPGFIDSHAHLLMFGLSLGKLDLTECKSLEDIRQTITKYAKSHPAVPRIPCRGWHRPSTGGKALDSMIDELDDRPIYIQGCNPLHYTHWVY